RRARPRGSELSCLRASWPPRGRWRSTVRRPSGRGAGAERRHHARPRLVLRPRPGVLPPAPTLALLHSATLADPCGGKRRLDLRGRGTGCFYTALTWRTGTSHLTLAATAGEEWAGGRAGLAISR
ncbi:hypothetical protein ACWEO4_45900, partial [Streptomyces sp. NPDC004393]